VSMKSELEALRAEVKKLRAEKDKTCPSCGHCPTCGRSAAPYCWPIYVAPWHQRPWYEQPYISWTGQVTTGGSSLQISDCGPQTTTGTAVLGNTVTY
jgi:hypothetical protein